MIHSVCYKDGKSAQLCVNTSDEERRITVSVHAWGLDMPIDESYPAERYGEALDRYRYLVDLIEGRHAK